VQDDNRIALCIDLGGADTWRDPRRYKFRADVLDSGRPGCEVRAEAGEVRRRQDVTLIADGTGTIDTQKVAVLAALAIADELHSSKREIGEREEMLKEQAERCLTLVERALKQTA